MSTDLSSSSLSSSVVSILLFSPSSEPFTLVFVFFSPNISIWLFFIVSSVSLLMYSLGLGKKFVRVFL